MPPASNRKNFQRTRVPRTERIASIACVALLAVIGAAIWWKGKHFDPDLYALNPEALKTTATDVEGKAGTVRGEGAISRGVVRTALAAGSEGGTAAMGGYEAEEAVAAPASPSSRGEPLEIKLDGLAPMGDTEFYNADNLYEKINGRAPAYLGFNFQQLRSRSFSVVGAAGSFVDVYEFRFDAPVNAFGMFALERDPKGAPLDFAADGYSGEMGFFFRQGTVYLQIMASDQNAKTLALARAIAQDRAKSLPADDAGLDARRRLPVTGLDPKSIRFVQENAQGQGFLKSVFEATYDFDGAKLPFFVMVAPPPETAAAWQSFLDFSGKYGGKATVLPGVKGAKIFKAESFGTWKIVYQRGGEVGGVFDAGDAAKARKFVEQYLEGKIQ